MEKKFIIRVLKTQNLIGIGQIVLNQALFYNRTEVYVELITILMTDIIRKQIFPGFKKLNDKIQISVRAKISYDAPLSLEDAPKLFSKSMAFLGPKGDAATKKISVNSHSVVNKTSQDTEILRFIENLKEKAFNSVTVNHPFLEFKMKNVENALKVFAFQYSWYSRNFVRFLRLIMKHLDPKDQEILEENISEEMGLVNEDELLKLGIDPSWVMNKRHTELFKNFQKALGLDMNLLEKEELFCEEVKQWTKDLFEICNKSPAMGIGALCFGTEAIVKPIYKKILKAIEHNTNLHPKDYIFYPLHIYFDDDHADSLEKLSIKYAQTQKGREEIEYGTQVALLGREKVFSAILKMVQTTSELYDLQAAKWDRKVACLSDLTARAPMFKDVNVLGKKILDLGCGEGYCTRILLNKGAIMTGIDISEQMIERAKSYQDGIKYHVGDVVTVDYGSDWDMITAVFLFNYLSLQQSYCVLQKCWSALKENGILQFSVPHPCFSQMVSDNQAFCYKVNNYFSDRDKLLEGIITKMDNTNKLNVRILHKTIEDYFKMMDGFKLLKFKELGVTEEIAEKYSFLEPIKNAPLHIEFILQKEARYPRNLNIVYLSFEECMKNDYLLETILSKNGCVVVNKVPLKKDELIKISSKLGSINENRGKVYEVYDRKLDYKQVNVLISATNHASGFHSDGSDKYYFPRIMGLMCVKLSKIGGETKLSNAYQAYIEMKKDYPELAYVLSQPIKHMLITSGLGDTKDFDLEKISLNEYPVFSHEPFTFRYMRLWIEMAYQVLKIEIDPKLVEAMNKLDEILEKNKKVFKLESGQVVFCQNGIIAHDRYPFEDDATSKRMMWRIWID
jgi:2-polyprenyl-3-methyl-5-hydroxy-6-metoxy-1,4-benzoquinol methylase